MSLSSNTEAIVKAIAQDIGRPQRSPILKTPKDHGMDFENLTFPSTDGVPLEAWYMPKEGSKKLIIANHPLWFNRYGLPAHLEPWKSIGSLAGNDFEVDFIPDYKILNDHGYNVLTYDIRNFGHSGSGHGGISGIGRFELRDVLGSIRFAKSDPRFKDMSIGLFSRCMGCNSTFFANEESPKDFEDVRCIVAPQPLSPRATIAKILGLLELSPELIDNIETEIQLINSLKLDDMSPVNAAKSVTVPTFLYQVKEDLLTDPSDVQAMFDNLPMQEKALHWIEGTTRRWDGYLYFQKNPTLMLEWFDKYMN